MGALTAAVRGKRLRLSVPLGILGGGLTLASAAWACAPLVPIPDGGEAKLTINSCTAPPGATSKCKPVYGTPRFPSATSVQGPAGSTLTASVFRGLIPGMKYDLQFTTKPQRKSGIACYSHEALVIGGPAVADAGGAVSRVPGTIPANAPLGLGHVCFSDVSYDTVALGGRDPNDATNQNHASTIAYFRVIL